MVGGKTRESKCESKCCEELTRIVCKRAALAGEHMAGMKVPTSSSSSSSSSESSSSLKPLRTDTLDRASSSRVPAPSGMDGLPEPATEPGLPWPTLLLAPGLPLLKLPFSDATAPPLALPAPPLALSAPPLTAAAVSLGAHFTAPTLSQLLWLSRDLRAIDDLDLRGRAWCVKVCNDTQR